MNKLEIDLKHFKEKSELNLDYYIVLSLICDSRIEDIWLLDGMIEDEVSQILIDLQAKMYIKILDNNHIELRKKAEDLFDKKKKNIFEELITFFNEETGKKFRLVTANTKFIQGRLNEGYTVEDLKDVVRVKAQQWVDTKMDDYLRPETLWNSTKFQGYYQEMLKWRENNKVFTSYTKDV